MVQAILSWRTKHPSWSVFVALLGGDTVREAEALLRHSGVFVTDTPESLVQSYKTLWRHTHTDHQDHIKHPHDPSVRPYTLFEASEIQALLLEYGIQSTHTTECRDIAEVERYIINHDGPFVMKIWGKHIAHKTEM